MRKKNRESISDSAVPNSDAMKRVPDHEKEALERGELAEHEHGTRRERLIAEAQRLAGNRQ